MDIEFRRSERINVNFYSRFSIVRHEDEPELPEASGNCGALFEHFCEKFDESRVSPSDISEIRVCLTFNESLEKGMTGVARTM